MSHYARLKVTQDAPLEVIRAAYRVLAAKYHPDRQGNGDAVNVEDAHAEMAALNTAYQVLVNPETRRDYDALLAERRALRKSKAAAKSAKAADGDVAIVNNTKVDMEWLPPQAQAELAGKHMSRRALFLGGSLTGVLIGGLVIWVWQLVLQQQMEQALSDHYAVRPAATVPPEPQVMAFPLKVLSSDAGGVPVKTSADSASAVAAAASARMPSVTDLSKLSNEELAQLLPALEVGGAGHRRVERHPLDGQPLSLRQDGQLIEVLPGDPIH